MSVIQQRTSTESFKKKYITVELSESLNHFLEDSAKRNGRSKKKELIHILDVMRAAAELSTR
ncbi:TraY domain-containing protein (plasmid) [Citrobacter sp. OP27]